MNIDQQTEDELLAQWQAGVQMLNEVARAMRSRGCDTGELDYALTHVDGKAPHVQGELATPHQDRLHRVERQLDSHARRAGYLRGPHNAWIICPRAHAESHGFAVLEWNRLAFFTALLAPELFKQFDRYHPGTDLVHASAPRQ